MAQTATFATVSKPEKYYVLQHGTDWYEAIQAAFDAAAAAGGGRVELTRPHDVSAQLTLSDSTAIAVLFRPGASLKATAVMDAVICKPGGAPASGIIIDNARIDGNLLAARGLDIQRARSIKVIQPGIKRVTLAGVDLGRPASRSTSPSSRAAPSRGSCTTTAAHSPTCRSTASASGLLA